MFYGALINGVNTSYRRSGGIFACTKIFTSCRRVFASDVPCLRETTGKVRAHKFAANVECRENRLKYKLKVVPGRSSAVFRNGVCANTTTTYPEILKSSLACRYFPGSRNYNSTFNLPGVTKVMPAATSRAFAPIQCIHKELRQMNATLVTFPGISSFECLTASPLNKFSRSVEQAPAMLQITLRVTYL